MDWIRRIRRKAQQHFRRSNLWKAGSPRFHRDLRLEPLESRCLLTVLAFASSRDGDAEIFTMNADGTNPTRLTDLLSYSDVPAWKPGGGTTSGTMEGFETGNFTRFAWTQSGNADWAITAADKHGGVYSVVSGDISDSQSSTLQVALTTIAGNLSFWRKVSSEAGYDYLTFYVDGVAQGT